MSATTSYVSRNADAMLGGGSVFELPKLGKNYDMQYCSTYTARSNQMKKKIREHARYKWGNGIHIVDKIIESQNQNTQCVLVGVTFKDLKLRSSVIEDVKEGLQLIGNVSFIDKYNYASKEDTVFLEDDSGRIRLKVKNEARSRLVDSGYFDPLLLVTGVVCGVKGTVTDADGDEAFEVDDVVYFGDIDGSTEGSSAATSALSNECLVPFDALNENSNFLMIVSGFEFDEDSFDPTTASTADPSANSAQSDYDISTQLLADFISGKLGDEYMKTIAKNISRVFVGGNSVVNLKAKDMKDRHTSSKKEIQDAARNLKRADAYFSQLLSTVAVTVMPGASDPALVFLPQQQLNKCLFPMSNRFSSCSMSTNPASFKLSYNNSASSVTVLGHSGQCSLDISLQITDERGEHTAESMDTSSQSSTLTHDPWIDIQARLIQWGHVAPTCPDTLPGYPLGNTGNKAPSMPGIKAPSSSPEDYFVITEKPDIFFAGNQPFFGCKKLKTTEVIAGQPKSKETLVVNVPSFKLERSAVIIDVNSKQCALISFNTGPVEHPTLKRRDVIGHEERKESRTNIDFGDDNDEPTDM